MWKVPLLLMFIKISGAQITDGDLMPRFTTQIANVSVPIGRDAMFTCNVKNLGSFKVGWVKADSKAIQAIQDVVITYNNRIRVSGDLHTTFNLHIAEIKEEDRGQYMCQINTDPMTFQTATLDVMVPPDITQSSEDQELKTGSTAKLECLSDGYPKPRISWKREDGQHIKFLEPDGNVRKRKIYNGTTLVVPKVTPADMGAYLCIAKNDVPPARSKRVYLYVQFPPKIGPQEQLLGYTEGGKIRLECKVNAYPPAMITWAHNDNWILPDEKFVISENNTSPFQKTSILVISDASVRQNGSYTCVAKNTLGFAKSLVRTYMLTTPSPPPTLSNFNYYDNDDDFENTKISNEHKKDYYSTSNNIPEERIQFIGSEEDEEDKDTDKDKRKQKRKKNNHNRRNQERSSFMSSGPSTCISTVMLTTAMILISFT